jgi:hypothetical protein
VENCLRNVGRYLLDRALNTRRKYFVWSQSENVTLHLLINIKSKYWASVNISGKVLRSNLRPFCFAFSFLWHNSQNRGYNPSFLKFIDHTQLDTPGRPPLNEWSARRRGRYLPNTHTHTQETNIHTLRGVRTRNPSNQAALDLGLRSKGHRGRLTSFSGI